MDYLLPKFTMRSLW